MSSPAAALNDWADPVVTRLEVSSPNDVPARERARLAESYGLPPQAAAQIPPPQRDNDPSAMLQYSTPPANAQKRQDFSHEKISKKETRLGNYHLGRTLGEGEFGKVKLGWKLGGNAQVAVKIIRKDKLQDQARMQKVFREVNILKGLEHPNIVRLHEMVETERTIGIVLEYAPCGELFNYILNQRYLKDNHAKKLFAQLVSAVGYLHKKGIIHRDLKLENLLLDRNQNIIVTDFGFANKFDPTDELGDAVESRLNDRAFVDKNRLGALNRDGFRRGDLMVTSCGSPCYAAPELVISDGLYTGRKVDVWSIGVILYAMLAGYLPYDDDPRNPDGDNINLLYSYISETELKFPDYVSPHARDLLKRILRPDPRKRADLFEVARHSWLSGFEDVVDAITSTVPDPVSLPTPSTSTTKGADSYARLPLTRSASARDAISTLQTPPPIGGLIAMHGDVGQTDASRTRPPREAKRQTLQVEYVAPQQPAQNYPTAGTSPHSPDYFQGATPASDYYETGSSNTRKRTWEDKGKDPLLDNSAAAAGFVLPQTMSTAQSARPTRDTQRAVSDSTAFASGQALGRPDTQGSMAGSRLPSRGSYGQPVAAQVAATNAQGRFSQPRLPVPTVSQGRAEDVSAEGSVNGQRFQVQKPQTSGEGAAAGPAGTGRPKRGHARSHTLSDLTQKVFGKTTSVKKAPDARPKPDRSHPPTSMKPMVDSPTASRKSTESRRSFGFLRKSTEFSNNNNNNTQKRHSRRFSFIPRFGAGGKETTPPATAEAGGQPLLPQLFNAAPLDGASDERATSSQYPTTTYPPSSYSQPYQYSSGPYSFRTASAGNQAPSTPTWPSQFQPLTLDQEGPSRTDSPAVEFAKGGEKANWESEGWSQSRKLQAGRSGPAQRVMDFFRGRRQDRSGLTA